MFYLPPSSPAPFQIVNPTCGTNMGPDTDYCGFMHAFTVASPASRPLLHAPACPHPLRKGGDILGVLGVQAIPPLQGHA